MSRNRRPSNRRGLRRPLWRVVEVTQAGPVEVMRGEHHDVLRAMLTLRQRGETVEVELVP